MGSMKKWVLGAALAVGALAMTAAPAQAARIGFYVGARAVAIPACPGPGYAWVGGYWNDGYWVPGYWNFVGVRVGGPVIRGGVVFGRGSGFYRPRLLPRRFPPLALITFAGSSAFCCLHHTASPNWRGRFFGRFWRFEASYMVGRKPRWARAWSPFGVTPEAPGFLRFPAGRRML